MMLKGCDIRTNPGLHVIYVIHVNRGWSRCVLDIISFCRAFSVVASAFLMLPNSAEHLLSSNMM